jgi:hypothetical protein
MAIKYTKIPLERPSKIYPNLDFWFGTISSDNPGGSFLKGKKERKHINLTSEEIILFFCAVHIETYLAEGGKGGL